jgi:hypothetical protein
MVAPVWIIDPQEGHRPGRRGQGLRTQHRSRRRAQLGDPARIDGKGIKTSYLTGKVRHRPSPASPVFQCVGEPWPGNYEVRVSQLGPVIRPRTKLNVDTRGFTVSVNYPPDSSIDCGGTTSGPGRHWQARRGGSRRRRPQDMMSQQGRYGPASQSLVTSRGLMPPSGPTIKSTSAPAGAVGTRRRRRTRHPRAP